VKCALPEVVRADRRAVSRPPGSEERPARQSGREVGLSAPRLARLAMVLLRRRATKAIGGV
jgi:hypothetical protein